MAISREKKVSLVQEYTEQLNSSRGFIAVTNMGLKVHELEELRTKIREAEGQFYIVKKTLLRRAVADVNLPLVDNILDGPIGIGFCHNNVSGVAKAITDFAKQNDRLVIKGGLLGDKVIDEAGVKNLASLPSLNELRGQLIGLINAPASQLVGVLSGGVRQLVNVVNAYAEKDKSAEEAPES